MIARNSKGKFLDKCGKCEKEKGTLFHMWWMCPLAKKNWDLVFVEMTKIYKTKLVKSLELMLLGLRM